MIYFITGRIVMNLHEKCLLKYLLNPAGLSRTTERLKLNNSLLEKGLAISNVFNKQEQMNYTTNRI
jgi:hypothetical protein